MLSRSFRPEAPVPPAAGAPARRRRPGRSELNPYGQVSLTNAVFGPKPPPGAQLSPGRFREKGAVGKTFSKGTSMALSTILLIIVILLLIGAVPAWPHSRGWGYGPSGLLGVILVILLILLLMGRL